MHPYPFRFLMIKTIANHFMGNNYWTNEDSRGLSYFGTREGRQAGSPQTLTFCRG